MSTRIGAPSAAFTEDDVAAMAAATNQGTSTAAVTPSASCQAHTLDEPGPEMLAAAIAAGWRPGS